MTAVAPPQPASLRQRLSAPTLGAHLAACSIAPRTSEVDHALRRMLDDLGRPGFWQACEHQATLARELFARLVGADVDQVAILPNASVAAYQAAASRRWGRRREILTTYAEFPGIAHVWLARKGMRVRWCGSPPGTVSADDYLAQITDRTGLVSVPLVTYRDSVRLDVRRVADAAHAAGAAVLVDAYQAAGVMPLDVGAMGCDYLVAGTGKYLLGLPGLAFLYVRQPGAGPAPTLTGWLGRAAPHTLRATVLDSPPHARRYETGTPAAAAVYAAVAGLSLVNDLDLQQVRRHTQRLIATTARRLRAQGEMVRMASAPDAQGAHLALVDAHPEAMSVWLGHRGIVTAPRSGVLRLATHAYTTDEDIDAACEAVAAYRHHAGHHRSGTPR
ncbi:aminotransferase class V-fold PLP-dependent enzyme [Micromonospora sp. WMMD1082]|uniref:aminotransferase class V-fold PLP-dependent enzyme n=1 Tax=Micromonospora sp. WMMD1082 TaxID=3016104 RepID=UPI00241675DC|nr:aminotransferase class V-fold PLP-dependent enzyme [Micromonospora sp. WMMD1082]MDG4794992.1 aminotransferase class V-fold PLP-dependent enzyme [Micromonospora sp. WMMD1082]